jgi:hypothetical protein
VDAGHAASSAQLGPGDAIFIPPLWWHQVESLDSFNMLVNYWWHDGAGDGAQADSAFDALLHSMLSIRSLPPATRRAWRAFLSNTCSARIRFSILRPSDAVFSALCRNRSSPGCARTWRTS